MSRLPSRISLPVCMHHEDEDDDVVLTDSAAEIYRIVSQKQLDSPESTDAKQPGGRPVPIVLAPTQAGAPPKKCC